jgi:hypothetical protein
MLDFAMGQPETAGDAIGVKSRRRSFAAACSFFGRFNRLKLASSRQLDNF